MGETMNRSTGTGLVRTSHTLTNARKTETGGIPQCLLFWHIPALCTAVIPGRLRCVYVSKSAARMKEREHWAMIESVAVISRVIIVVYSVPV